MCQKKFPHFKFSALKTCFRQRSSSTPAGSQTQPSPPSGHPPPLLAVKLTPLHPAVILHPCWQSNSPFSTQRSSYTPASGQTHPSPPSGHPPPLLAVKLTPLHPAIILHPCWQWQSNSPLSTQRSSSTPASGQLHPSHQLLVIQGERNREEIWIF